MLYCPKKQGSAAAAKVPSRQRIGFFFFSSAYFYNRNVCEGQLKALVSMLLHIRYPPHSPSTICYVKVHVQRHKLSIFLAASLPETPHVVKNVEMQASYPKSMEVFSHVSETSLSP
jgi:hypothetical protein